MEENKYLPYKPTPEEVQAVEHTIDMWEYLATYPYMHKTDYFVRHNIKLIPVHGCFLCGIWNPRSKSSYTWCGNLIKHGVRAGDYSRSYESHCPLGTHTLHCFQQNSPFSLWAGTWESPFYAAGSNKMCEIRTYNAKRIEGACARWLLKHAYGHKHEEGITK